MISSSPDWSREIWTIIGDQTPEDDGGARLEIFFHHGVTLIIDCGECGNYDYQVNHQRCRRMTVDLGTILKQSLH